MKIIKKVIFPLIVILILVRWINLATLPAQLNRDEAALAYNALLLSEKGVDEWGEKWPLTLKSFGDYKLIGYPSLLVGLFQFLPKNDLVVRLPSALAGLALLFAAWLWGKELGLSKFWRIFWLFIIASTPTFFMYSRSAYEANVALALILFSTYFGWKRKWLLASLFYLWAGLTYNTPLLIGPVLLIFYLLQRSTKAKEKILAVTIQSALMVLLIFWLWPVLTQKSGITIFNDETVWANWISWRSGLAGFWQLLLGNRQIYWLGLILKNLINSFGPKFLVISGGQHPWHILAGWGHLLWPTYLFGLLGWIKSKTNLAWKLLILGSLAPALVTVDAPHATRSLLFIFGFTFFAVEGIRFLTSSLAAYKHLIIWIFIFSQSIWFIFFVKDYFIKYPSYQASLFQSGLEDVLSQVEAEYPNHKIAVQDGQGFRYVLFAWYLKLNPDVYLSTNVRQLPDTIGFSYGEQVDRFHFVGSLNDRRSDETVGINWDEKSEEWQILNFQ